MVNLKLSVIATAMVFALTACGSSGDSSGAGFGRVNFNSNSQSAANSATNNGTTKTSGFTLNKGKTTNTANTSTNTVGKTTTPTPANTATTKPAVQANTNNGLALIGYDRNGANVSPVAISSADLNKVTIDGTEVTLSQPGISAGTFTTISNNTKETIASGRALSYSRIGAYRDVNDAQGRNPSFTVVVGSVTPTAQVPTSGQATYDGLSLVSIVGGGAFSKGTSNFNVDFGSKKIMGTVKADSGVTIVPLEGKIDGASFSGTKDGVNMSGQFYGPQAAELGGVFNGTQQNGSTFNELMGVFGATKQ